MDRLLFGDNQFFGVNHMSEEKARAQAMRFQDIDAVIEVLDAAYDEGVRTFMCTTHDRIAEVCDHVRAQPGALRATSTFYPCMPYAHKYANAVTEDGMLGAIRALPARRGAASTQRSAAASSLATQGHRGHHDAADRRRDEDVRRACRRPVDLPAERDRRPAARARASTTRSGSSPTTCATRYGAEPGFITMNLPRAARRPRPTSAIENPIVCSNINKIGFRMCGGVEAYRDGAARAAASGRSRCRCSPPARSRRRRRSSGSAAQPNIESIVFGASSRAQHPQHPRARRPHWELSDARLLVASTGGHLKQLHRLRDRGSRASSRPIRWVDLRHAAEPLAAGGRGGRLRATSSAGGTRATSRATSRRAADPQRAAVGQWSQHRLAVALPFFASAGRTACPATTSRAPRAATGPP